MVSAILLTLHGIAGVVAFVFWNRKGGIGDGLLAVALFGIIFSVGWTIMTMLTGLVMDEEGLARWLDRDAVTLLLLTGAEGGIYVALLKPKAGKNEEGTT